MFERFTDAAQAAVAAAEAEARHRQRDEVDSAHLLIGVIAADESWTAELAPLGVTVDAIRSVSAPGARRGAGLPVTGHVPYGPDLSAVLSHYALVEALRAGARMVDCAHLVGGVLADPSSPGAAALTALGRQLSEVRALVGRRAVPAGTGVAAAVARTIGDRVRVLCEQADAYAMAALADAWAELAAPGADRTLRDLRTALLGRIGTLCADPELDAVAVAQLARAHRQLTGPEATP